MPRKHDESGNFTETVSHADVLDVFEEVSGPVMTSADGADLLGCTRETVRRKLKELYEQNKVDRRKSAGRLIYWRTEATEPPEQTLKSLSQQLGQPIIVGEQVFEDGDVHPLSETEVNEQ